MNTQNAEDKQVSKFLSLVLRHEPEAASITLDPAGWAVIDELAAGAASKGKPISRADIERIAATSEKKRFTISDDGRRIRAAQGHSVSVELGLKPSVPPEFLWHGTAETSLASIRTTGLKPGKRRHVHLSPDPITARNVGMRHGRPVVLQVATLEAHDDGQAFWLAENGVWLTDSIAYRYISELDAT